MPFQNADNHGSIQLPTFLVLTNVLHFTIPPFSVIHLPNLIRQVIPYFLHCIQLVISMSRFPSFLFPLYMLEISTIYDSKYKCPFTFLFLKCLRCLHALSRVLSESFCKTTKLLPYISISSPRKLSGTCSHIRGLILHGISRLLSFFLTIFFCFLILAEDLGGIFCYFNQIADFQVIFLPTTLKRYTNI